MPPAGHAFATNPLLSPWVALGLPGGRPLGMAADTRIRSVRMIRKINLSSKFSVSLHLEVLGFFSLAPIVSF